MRKYLIVNKDTEVLINKSQENSLSGFDISEGQNSETTVSQ